MKQQKFIKRKIEFLQDFLIFALQQLNKYIKFNDVKEIDIYNKTIVKTLTDIATLKKQLEN
jgi:hypothetical protein